MVDKSSNRNLDETEKSLALQLARQSLENYFGRRDNITVDLSAFPIFNEPRGAFVTLYEKETGKLRGCIGQVVAQQPLAETIKQMAIAAAVDDPRFLPMTADELDKVKIEISVLSPLYRIQSVNQIELGKHGVVVRQGARSGVFLPQVAKETGWDLVSFLSHLCADKAGLEPDCWQKDDVEIYIFTGQTFSEG